MRVISPSVQFKELSKRDEFYQLDDRLQFILEDCSGWVTSHGYEFVITDMLSEEMDDIKLGRVSTSHRDGRAADVRTRDWPQEFVKKFLIFIDAAHGHHGAISFSDGKRRVAVYHKVTDNAYHLHIQVKKRK